MDLIIASDNEGKIKEYRPILEPFGYNVISKAEAGIKITVEETGKDFRENACLKASAIYNKIKCPTLADDSGLSINYLNGMPGLKSARFMEGKPQSEKNKFILKSMENASDRSATFTTAICFIDEFGKQIIVEGKRNGKISLKPRGTNGFGYDSIFIPEGLDKTNAELTKDEKNKVSSRAKAVELLKEELSKR